MAEPKGAFDPRLFSSNRPYPVQVIQPYNASTNRRPAYMRFLYTSALAALAWYVCATFLRSVVYFLPWQRPYPIPPHVNLDSCVSYDDWSILPVDRPELRRFPFAAVTSFDLPLSAETLSLLSRGPNSGGSVEITTSPEQDQDVATVEVAVRYIRQNARNDAKVCQVLTEDGGFGVGIFTRRRRLFSRLHFATKIIFPEFSDKSPVLIKKLETDVHNTVHRVGDLNEKVLFQSLHLQGSNGPIDVQSVKADQGTFKTSNGGISGAYNTSSLLILTTTNGRVQTEIGLSSIDGSEPKLVLATTNGAVESRISLFSDNGIGGSFDVTTSASNGRLDIEFPDAPPDSILKFGGETSNAGAIVSVNSAYEGSFLLQTSSIFKPQINRDEGVVDPSGKNRQRSINIKQAGIHVVSGQVFWDDATEQKVSKAAAGSIYMHTSNADIDLFL